MKREQFAPAILSGPERGLVVGALLVWAISVPVLFLLYRTLDPSPDQSIFDYIAWLTTQGVLPYAGSFEVNWPGSILIHIAAQTVFGPHDYAARSFDFLIMQASAIAAAGMLWRNGMRVGAALLLALYPPIYITAGVWMVGQRDIVAVECLMIACLFLAGPRRTTAGLVAAGALCAFAFAVRPTYLAFLAGAVLLEWIWPAAPVSESRDRWRSAGAIVLGASLLISCLILLGLATGTLAPWYEAAIRYALDCYSAQSPPQSMTGTPFELLTNSWHWIASFALGGALLWTLRGDVGRFPLVLCLGLIATCVLSFVVQHKGFGYHLGGLLPLFTLLLAACADSMAKAATGKIVDAAYFPWKLIPRPLWAFGLAVMLLICLAGTASKLRRNIFVASNGLIHLTMQRSTLAATCEGAFAADSAAAFIAKTVTQSAYVLPINCGYRAAFLARRLPASRFATSTSFTGSKFHCSLGDKLLQDYAADIRTNKPALILASSENFDPKSQHMTLLPGSPDSAARAAALASDYQRVAQFGDLLIFSRETR